MKKKIIIIAMAVLVSGLANSQEVDPAWVCESGYWVVVSNVRVPKSYTVYFYNDQHLLVGKKIISGKKLNLKRARTLKMLKTELESTLQAWAAR